MVTRGDVEDARELEKTTRMALERDESAARAAMRVLIAVARRSKDAATAVLRTGVIDHVVALVPPPLIGTFGPTVSVSASSSTSISEVEEKVALALSVPSADVSVSIPPGSSGGALAGSSTLGALGVSNGALVGVTLSGSSATPPPPAPAPPYVVHVALPASLQAAYGPSVSLATSGLSLIHI